MTRFVDSKLTLREWLPLIGITVSAFIFNTSEFMPVGLLTGIGAGSFIGGGVCTFGTIADVGFVGAFIVLLALLYCAFLLVKHMKVQATR